jgi:prephenate dehydrogenase
VQPKRLTILGVGLLGGSIGLALKAAGSAAHVVGYGHRRSTLDTALKMGAIDEAATSAEASVKDSDWVILATPVGLFEHLLQQIAPALSANAIVTDVGSTKRSIVRQAESTLRGTVHFIGSHPMAGSEKRGVEFAKPDLFTGARCILTPTRQSDPAALAAVEAFWQSLGSKTVQMSPEDHDRHICDISHLPHAIAAALVAMQSEEALPLAGQGFLDTTRIAGGDGGLWRDIFIDNRDNVADSVKRFRAKLDELLGMLASEGAQGQRDELARWLDAAAERRRQLFAAKVKELHAE